MFDLVDNAQVSKAGELWEQIKKLDVAKRNKIFKVIEIMLQD
jgi:hypothetical protein